MRLMGQSGLIRLICLTPQEPRQIQQPQERQKHPIALKAWPPVK